MMTNQELFEALHKSQIKAKRLMRKNKKLKRRFNKLNRALDKACKNWEGEVPDCDFLVMQNNLCDCKCGLCNKEKRIKYRKEWCMRDD